MDAAEPYRRGRPSCAGEKANADRIAYGIPDVVGAQRSLYAGTSTLVIGSGHSAINVALALMELQPQDKATEILWALRHANINRLPGGGLNDKLPERPGLSRTCRSLSQNQVIA